MRVAFVGGFGFRPKGTIQGRAFPLAVELVRHGHTVTIFVTPYDNLQESGRDWVEEGVRIKGIRSGSTPFSYPGLLVRLLSEIESYRPDIVHIFKPKGFAGAAGTYLHLKRKRHVVLDCDDWEGWGGFNEINSYPWILKEYIDRQERWMMRSTPAVTVASRSLENRVLDVRQSSRGVYYLPNCGTSADNLKAHERARAIPQAEARKEFGLPDGPIIFYYGHFEPGDDFMMFCRAATPAAERSGASIVFVGEGPELKNLKQFFVQHPAVKVLFFPRLSYDAFVRLIWASDVTAFPYPDDPVHRSKCSLRVIDYMAMGKPVITSAVGQNKEYIVDGESGILVPPGDDRAFTSKLELLLQHPSLRQQIGHKAAQRIRDNFTWGGHALTQCLAAYDQVASCA